MNRLSLKEFIEKLSNRLDSLNYNELKAIILDYAESLTPDKRESYLHMFTSKEKTRKKKVKPSDGDYLLKEIEAFGTRADDYEYSDGWGWDDEYGDERALGDDAWVEEIDDLFDSIDEFYRAGAFALAARAYEILLDIYFGGNEEGQFSGYYHDEMITTDLQEAVLKYLRCIYMIEKAEDRPDELFDAMGEYYGYVKMDIKGMMHVSLQDLPDFEQFGRDWVAYLKKQPPSQMADTLLKEAVRLFEGSKGLEILALEQGSQFPGAYVEWLDTLKKEALYEDMIRAALLGMERLPDDLVIRADIADYLREAAQHLEMENHVEKALKEALYASPCIERLLDLLDYGKSKKQREQYVDGALARFADIGARHPEKVHMVVNIDRSPDLRETHVSEAMEIYSRLLKGDYERSAAYVKDGRPLGWSQTDNINAMLTPFFLYARWNKEKPLTANMSDLWKEATALSQQNMGNIEGTVTADNPRFRIHLENILTEYPLDHEKSARYFSIAEESVKKRVDGIVGNKYQKSYWKAARLLLSVAEVYWSNDERAGGQTLINQFRDKYNRHSAFKRELKVMAHKSRIFSV